MAGSISVSGSTVTFTTTAGSEGIARSEITTAAPTDDATFLFSVTRRPLKMRAGTSAGGQEIFTDITVMPGTHLITFAPLTSPYFIEFRLPDTGYVGAGEGKATLVGFQALDPGELNLPTPWLESRLRDLRFEQSFDVAWIATRDEQTRVLEHRGARSWSLRLFQPENGPFGNLNVSATTLTSSSQTGQTTVSASTPLFRTTHPGALLKIIHQGQYVTAALNVLDEVSETIRVTGTGDNRKFNFTLTGTFNATILIERSVGNELNWVTYQTYTTVQALTFDDDLDNQIVYYRAKCSVYTSGSATVEFSHANGVTEGIARIVSVEADNSATCDVISPIGKTTATTDWAFGAWSDAAGWLTAVALSDGRLWGARDDRFWASASDDFEDFEVGAADDDSFTRRVTGGWGSAVWLAGVGRLMIGMDAREAEIGSNALDDVVTPTTAKSRPRSRRGSANAQGQVIDEAVAFVDRSRRKLFRMELDGTDYALAELTRLHRTIAGDEGTTDGFIECAVQYNPEPRIWLPCDDGRMSVILFEPTEGVAAWCRLVDPGAFYESVCVLPGDVEDSVYFVVRRTIEESTVRYVEKLAAESWEDMEDVWRLRSAVEYSGVSTTSITGLSHLEGESVYAWANGQQQGPFTVASGAITLTYAATYAIVGLLYEGKYKSPKMTAGGQMGTALMQDKQIKRLGMLVHRTAPGALKWGRDFTTMAVLRGDDPATYDTAMVAITEDLNNPFNGATEKDARVCISMPTAGPATVLGLVPHLEVNERTA
jgi:hypothetical protein